MVDGTRPADELHDEVLARVEALGALGTGEGGAR